MVNNCDWDNACDRNNESATGIMICDRNNACG